MNEIQLSIVITCIVSVNPPSQPMENTELHREIYIVY